VPRLELQSLNYGSPKKKYEESEQVMLINSGAEIPITNKLIKEKSQASFKNSGQGDKVIKTVISDRKNKK
jgi:hypothetical protein